MNGVYTTAICILVATFLVALLAGWLWVGLLITLAIGGGAALALAIAQREDLRRQGKIPGKHRKD